MNSGTGAITGTPTTTGTYTVTVGASNGSGSGIKTVTLTIGLASPVISSPPTANGATGIAFTYAITATNGPTSFNATGLPSGLSVNTTTGAITGSPTTAGTFPVTLSATNAGGTGTATLTLSVSLSVPVITSSGTATGVTGTNLNYTITASSTPTSFGATGLPAGLTLNTATGAIQGAAIVSGNFTVQMTATNATGTGWATLTLTINAAPSVLPVTSGLTAWFEANAGVTNQAGSVTQWNDQTANQYDVGEDGYAPGIGQDADSGLPVVTFNGNQLLTTSAQVSGLDDVTIITVAGATDPDAGGNQTLVTVGALYDNEGARIFSYTSGDETFGNSNTTATGGSVPANSSLNINTVTFSDSGGTANFYSQGIADGMGSITATSLASGLTLGSGSYTPSGSWNGNIAEVIVYNRVLSTAERQAVEGYLANKYNIYAPGAGWIGNYSSSVQTLINQNLWSQAQTIQYLQTTYPVPSITSSSTATGFVGGAFSYTITGSNSPTYFEASGLPSGLSVNSTSGAITGTPTTAGTYPVTLTAFNANGTGQTVLSLTVQPAIPVISSSLAAGGTQGLPFSYTITAGSGATSFGATGLPTGLSVNTGSGVISGTPTATGTSTVTLTATNINGTGQATMTLTVYAPLPVTSGLSAWYSAQAGVATSNGGVTQWNDQTGQYNLTQSAGASAPSFGADPLTGKPVVQFNGSQFLSNGSRVTGVNDVTIITVGSVPTTGESGVQVQVGAGYGSACSRGLAYVGGNEAFTNGINSDGYFTSVSGGPAVQNSSLALNTVTYSAASSLASFYSDGSANGTATLSTVATASGLIVGDAITYGNYYNWDGNIAEIIVYDRVLSTAERQQVENYLATKYNLPPVINSPTTATGVTGTAFNYTVTATDVPTTYSATGLPAGLSISSSTGVISGTPSATGVSYVTVTASNIGGSSSETLTLSVYAPVAPVITSPTTTSAVVGQAFNYVIVGNNNTTSYNATGLPSGLSVNTTTGAITGTPTSTGTSTVVLSAINAYGTGTANLTLTIYPTLPVTSGLAAWFNSDVGVTTSSGNVTQWNDQSGNGYNVTQTVGPNAPGIGQDADSGLPVVTFNGNQLLTTSAQVSGLDDVTIITVAGATDPDAGGNQTLVTVGALYDNEGARIFSYTSGDETFGNSNTTATGGSVPANSSLNINTVTFSDSGGTANFYSQGIADGMGSITATSLASGLTLGSGSYTPSGSWNGNIAEVIVYNRVLSTAERQAVEGYLANKYGTYVPGASWISSYTTAVQAEINRNHWNKNQADAYVALQNANSGMLTNGLKMWLKADAGAVTNGSNVTSWLDQTGNYNLTQSTVANQPTYVASESDGKPGLHFNGNQWLFNPASMGVGMNQDSTIITVASTPTPQNNEYLAYLGNQSGYSCRGLAYLNSSQGYDLSSGDSVTGAAAPTNTWTVDAATLASNGVSVAFYQNGIASGTATLANAAQPLTPGITVGAYNNNGQPWTGDISEVLVYDHSLSSSEMQQVSLYLAGKYGFYYPGASWISSFTTSVQAEINRNQWNKAQANNYVALQNANPSMLTNGLMLWLKADAGVSTGIGSYVQSWTDQAQHALLTEGNPLSQPALVTESNGTKALRFSGSQSLTSPGSLGAGVNSDMTVITVAAMEPNTGDTNSGTGIGLDLGNATTGGTRALGTTSSYSAPYFDTTGSTATQGTAPTFGTFTMEAAEFVPTPNPPTASPFSAGVTFYSNGTQTGTTQSLSNAIAPNAGITVGSAYNGANFWSGDISEVLVYNHQLSSAELQEVGVYLANKYGTYYPGAAWITGSGYSQTTITAINANQWTKAVADQYVQVAQILPVTSGLTAWFKADSGVATNGTSQVTGWQDSSWNHHDVTPPTTANAPALGTDPGTGKPTLQFNGTSDYLANNDNLSAVNDVTIITVASTPNYSSATRGALAGVGLVQNGVVQRELLYDYGKQSFSNGSSGPYVNLFDGGPDAQTTALTNSTVTFASATGIANFYINGVANSSATVNVVAPVTTGLEIGSIQNFVSNIPWNGNISEVLIYNRALSSTEVAEVQTYLASKYTPLIAAPTISPNGGNIQTSTNITLSGATSPAVIRYTLDGTLPTGTSAQYSAAFNLTTDGQKVNCAIFNGTTQISQMATAQFWIGDTYHIGIPDAWQTAYLGSVTDLNPNALTPGGSGLTYLQAYQWGYNPTVYSTNGDGLSDSINYQLGYAGSDTDINGYLTGTGSPMTNAQQLALGLDPFDVGVNPPQPTPPATNPNDHTPPPITLNQPANAILLP